MSRRSLLLGSALMLACCACICFSILIILELVFLFSDYDTNSIQSTHCRLTWCRFYIDCAKGLNSWSWLFTFSTGCSHLVQAEIFNPNGNNDTKSISGETSYDDLYWSNECNTISIQTPLNWTCYFDSSESNPKFHLYPTNAQKNAVFPTTLATCVFGLVFFSVCLCACRLTRKALKLRTNTRFYSPPVFDRNKHLHKKKRKQRKITFEAKVAMNLILRFSRVLLANDEIEKRKNQTKKLLIHVIIRTVCQNIGKLNAISISDIIDYGSNKLSLVSSGQSEKQLFQNFILDLIEEPFQKLKLKTSNNSVVALDIGYYADEGGEKHEERKGKKEEEENSDSESSESDV